MTSFYDKSEIYQVNGATFRVLGNGRDLVNDLLSIEPRIVIALSIIPWATVIGDLATVCASDMDVHYTLALLRSQGHVIESVEDNVISFRTPFTLPSGFSVNEMHLMYSDNEGTIGLELHPDYVSAYLRMLVN